MTVQDDRPNGQTDEVQAVRDGYRTAESLNARSQIYRYNEDPYPWQRRVFDHLALPAECQLLEVGCGPGKLWLEKRRPHPARLVRHADRPLSRHAPGGTPPRWPALAAASGIPWRMPRRSPSRRLASMP